MPVYRLNHGAGAIVARKNGARKVDRLYAVNGILSVGKEYSDAMKSHVANGSAVEIEAEEAEKKADIPDRSNIITSGIKKS